MKNILLIFAMLAVSFNGYSQLKPSDVFQGDDLVWYGLDFSGARFIGQFDQAVGAAPATAYDLKTKYIPGWNSLIVSEPTKYDIGKTFRKTNVYNDLSPVETVNDRINEDNMMTFNDFSFEDPEAFVSQCVKKYKGGDKASGLGVVFVIESFHKDNKEATLYVTFFDISSKNILFSEKVIGKARGIGLRNFWGGAVYNVLQQIQKSLLNNWKKKYA